jgi:hypothetical protein
MTAEIGAKNGRWWMSCATSHAVPAAIEVWAIVQASARTRPVRSRT